MKYPDTVVWGHSVFQCAKYQNYTCTCGAHYLITVGILMLNSKHQWKEDETLER